MKCIPYHETKEQEFIRIFNLCKQDSPQKKIDDKILTSEQEIKLYSLGSYGAFGNVTGGKPFLPGLKK